MQVASDGMIVIEGKKWLCCGEDRFTLPANEVTRSEVVETFEAHGVTITPYAPGCCFGCCSCCAGTIVDLGAFIDGVEVRIGILTMEPERLIENLKHGRMRADEMGLGSDMEPLAGRGSAAYHNERA